MLMLSEDVEFAPGGTHLEKRVRRRVALRGGGAGNDCLNLNFRQNFP